MAARLDARFPQGYTAADQTNDFEYDTGVVVLPVASREAAHCLIRLHGGLGFRRAKWRAARTGNPPIIPAMGDTTGDTFLGGTASPDLPTPSRSGSGYDWVARGEYLYVQDTPRIVGTNPLPVGQHPFLCVDQAMAAAETIGNELTEYLTQGSPDFQSVVTAAVAAVTVETDGSYSWPFLAYPTVFTSTHLIQD